MKNSNEQKGVQMDSDNSQKFDTENDQIDKIKDRHGDSENAATDKADLTTPELVAPQAQRFDEQTCSLDRPRVDSTPSDIDKKLDRTFNILVEKLKALEKMINDMHAENAPFTQELIRRNQEWDESQSHVKNQESD